VWPGKNQFFQERKFSGIEGFTIWRTLEFTKGLRIWVGIAFLRRKKGFIGGFLEKIGWGHSGHHWGELLFPSKKGFPKELGLNLGEVDTSLRASCGGFWETMGEGNKPN